MRLTGKSVEKIPASFRARRMGNGSRSKMTFEFNMSFL